VKTDAILATLDRELTGSTPSVVRSTMYIHFISPHGGSRVNNITQNSIKYKIVAAKRQSCYRSKLNDETKESYNDNRAIAIATKRETDKKLNKQQWHDSITLLQSQDRHNSSA